MLSPRTLRLNQLTNKNKHGFIYIQKIDVQDQAPIKIRFPKKADELLKIATDVLELPRPAKRLCTETGETISDYKEIQPEQVVYISSVEINNSTSDDDEIQYMKTRTQKATMQKTITLPKVKQPRVKKGNPDSLEYQSMAASELTFKENMQNSLLTLYSSMTPEQQSQLSCEKKMADLLKSVQAAEFEKTLIEHLICPKEVIDDTEIGHETIQFAINQLKSLPLDKCQFVITGPSQSGKTTLLSIMSKLVFQKIQIIKQTPNFLFFPLNWLAEEIHFDQVNHLYSHIVKITCDSLKLSRKDLTPLIPSLYQWLISLITISAQPPLPPILLHFPSFPSDAINVMGRSIHSAYFNDRQKFIESALRLPTSIARAFGMTDVIYIFDHFDCANMTILNDSNDPIQLAPLICQQIQSSPYLIASLDDKCFFKAFTLTGTKQLPTERIIKNLPERQLLFSNPQISLTSNMTNGCPGYVAQLISLCKLAEDFSKRKVVKSPYSRFKSISDIARNEFLRQELFRVCLLLSNADHENFDDTVLESILSVPELTFQIR